MRQKHRLGFSLVELMVAVAIIAVLASGAVIGIGGTADEMEVRESAKYIKDVVQKAELRALKEPVTMNIRFLPGFLVIDEVYEGGDAGVDTSDVCTSPEEGFAVVSEGQLTQTTDLHGMAFAMEVYADEENPQPFCFDFDNARDTEWIFEMTSEEENRVIRYIHFNLLRDNPGKFILDTAGDDLRLVIIGPQIKARYFKNGESVSDLSFSLVKADDLSVSTDISFP